MSDEVKEVVPEAQPVETQPEKEQSIEMQPEEKQKQPEQQEKNGFKPKWYHGVLALVVAAAGCVGGFKLWLDSEGVNKGFAVEGNRMVAVKPGMTTNDIAQLLHQKKLVKNPKAFAYQARWDGLATKLQAGMYQLKGGMSNKELVENFVKGKVRFVKFVVPEGYSVKKIAAKLQTEELGNAEKFMTAAKNYAPYPYMKTDRQGVNYAADGFIFPATYDFSYGISEEKMLQKMVQTFDHYMEKEGIKKIAAERKLDLHDVVTMASMVELEAVYAEEHKRIAGVFDKRVKIGMPIQSDTTIQYLLGKQKEVVLYKDLEIDSPYNTYKYAGLPPGPIGSPGVSAIKAVLEPEKNEFLYFVAEKDGHHRFTKTFAEHNKAINDIENGR